MITDQNKNTNYILFLPKWYPGKQDAQLGVFIQKHASAVAMFRKVLVLYVCGDATLKDKVEVTINEQANLIEYFVYYRKAKGYFARLLNLYRHLTTGKKLMETIFKTYGTPQLIHSHVLLRPALIAWYYSTKNNIPYVHTEHWTGFIHDAYSRKSGVYKYFCRKTIAEAAAVTVVSNKLQEAMASYKLMNPRTLVLPNVIEVIDAPPIQNKTPGVIRILTVADLVERNKNVSGVIRALSMVRKRIPGFEYHIIGGGQDEELLHSLARELDPGSEWIIFHGRKDNSFVLEFLHSIDFLITNSNIETFSVITAEAIASGKPVIATRCGGPEYFVHENNGLLISPGHQDELQEAILKMIGIYKDYIPTQLSSEIIDKFGKAAVGQRFIDLYDSLLSK